MTQVLRPRHRLSFPRSTAGLRRVFGLTPRGSEARGQRAEIWCPAPPTPVTQHPLPQLFHKQPSLPKPQPGVGPVRAWGRGTPLPGGAGRAGRGSSAPAAPSGCCTHTSSLVETPLSIPVDPQAPRTRPGLVECPQTSWLSRPEGGTPRPCFVLCTSNPWAQWLCYGSQTPTAPLPPGSLTTALRSPRPNAAPTRAPSHLLPGPHGRPWSKQRDVGVNPTRSYRELNARVPAFPAWPMQSSPVGAVAGVSPPPAQHGAAGPPAQGTRPWAPAAWVLLQGPRPLCAPHRGSLTPKGCGLGLPARFFLEMEGVFISSRFFLENMVGPGPSGPRQAGWGHAGWGVSTLQLSLLAASGPHCRRPPPPQLSGPRDRPSPHWRALPPTGKGLRRR